MLCPACLLLLTAQICSCGSYSYRPVPAPQLLFPPVGSFGKDKIDEVQWVLLVLAYIQNIFHWFVLCLGATASALLQLLFFLFVFNFLHCNPIYYRLKSWSDPQLLCAHNGILVLSPSC